MLDKLNIVKQRFDEVADLIIQPDIIADQKRYVKLNKEYKDLKELVDKRETYIELSNNISEAEEIIADGSDAEMTEMAKMQLDEAKNKLPQVEEEIKFLLIPKDPEDEKDVVMEIRAGTGGEEAALFVADLFRMYTYYSERQGWKIEIMSSNETGIGGFKEIIFSITGNNVFENFKYESGVHRVQRVPVTESGGRIHTSAVTVAVLPEAEETEVEILGEDIRIDVYRSSGPGGQSVNTTDSAVRLTHLPTGLVVTCQDEKSQHKNKAKAMRVLRARLYDLEESKQHDERAKERKNQIGSGDRSERIRTYNFPQNRVTDHRINLTLYKLNNVVEGELGDIIEALKLSSKETLIKLELQ